MIRDNYVHGFPAKAWDAAKSEARAIMVARARRKRDISYTDLVAGITHIALEAHDIRLDHLLGEIAQEEDAAGRGLLTVLVVHKTGDKMPGPGFFQMAESRGRDISDKEALWVHEMRKVQETWAKK